MCHLVLLVDTMVDYREEPGGALEGVRAARLWGGGYILQGFMYHHFFVIRIKVYAVKISKNIVNLKTK